MKICDEINPKRSDQMKKFIKILTAFTIAAVIVSAMSVTAFAATTSAGGGGGGGGGGDVASAIEDTWDAAKGQIKQVVNNVVFPVIDVVLAVLFFAKVATAYMDYRKHGKFEFTAPAILFACLVFSMTAPLYIWSIVGI